MELPGSSREMLLPLFDAMPVGIIALDPDGRVVFYNAHEERMAGRSRERVLGRPFFDEIAPCLDVQGLGGKFREHVRSGTLDEEVEVSFAFPHADRPRSVVVKLRSFIAGGVPHGMLIIEDVTMARSLDRLRETLAQLLVHDMKSPLANISANLQFLEGEQAATESREAIADALTGARRLDRMVRMLLDLSRLETSTFPLVKGPWNVASIVRSAVRDVNGTARERDIELVIDVPPECETADHCMANVDGDLVERMAVNLLDNAIAHSPLGKRVVVRVAAERDVVRVDVSDEGAGVPPAVRERVFDKFVQAAAADDDGEAAERRASNHGLGLTFVRMAARAHGGDACVLPDARTGATGATFRIELPR